MQNQTRPDQGRCTSHHTAAVAGLLTEPPPAAVAGLLTEPPPAAVAGPDRAAIVRPPQSIIANRKSTIRNQTCESCESCRSCPVPVLRAAPPLARPTPEDEPSSHEQLCAGWLLAHHAAAGGPVRPHDVVKAALRAGFSRLTLYRARRACGAQIADLGTGLRDPNKMWELAVLAEEASQPLT